MINEMKAYFKANGITNIVAIYMFHFPEEAKARVQRALQGRSKNKVINQNLIYLYEQYRFNRKDS